MPRLKTFDDVVRDAFIAGAKWGSLGYQPPEYSFDHTERAAQEYRRTIAEPKEDDS